MPTDEAAERLFRSFTAHDPAAAIAVIEEAKAAGIAHDDLFDAVFVPALAMLGARWADGELDELAFTEAAVVAEQVTSFVIPPGTAPDRGVAIVVGCLEGDRHDLRKNLFSAALKAAGYRVLDLGVETSSREFLRGVGETGARIVIACAEMVGSAPAVPMLREALDAAGRNDVVLLVAGGPFEADPDVAKVLGAQGVANSAQSVLRVVERVVADLGSVS
jgi:methylmalonyl-CoA mutase cobalamin-binding domain/chain